MKIKGLAAAVVIAGSLAVVPAFAVPDPDVGENETVRQEKRGPEEKDLEKQDLKKKEKGLDKQDRQKKEKDLENKDLKKEENLENQDLKEKDLENEDLKKNDQKKNHEDDDRKKGYEEFAKDPLGTLENRKSEVQRLLKEGKISEEKARAIIRKIDAGIAEIKEFNRLTLEQKRAKLIKDCKDYLDNQVEKGEMDRSKAKLIYEEYSDKISKWDGTGYPGFFRKSFRHRK